MDSGLVTDNYAIMLGNQAASLSDKMSSNNAQEVAKEFEATFLAQMLDPIMPDDEGSGIFGGQSSGSIYKSMMLEQYGRLFAENGGIGIQEQISKDLLDLQEVK